MSTEISLHGITQIEIKPREFDRLKWAKIIIHHSKGTETELVLFFDQDHQREMFLEQIGLKVLA